MNPDVARAIPDLEQSGALTPEQASFLGRVAKGELVSVRPELLVALYAGVLLIATGVGLLLKENLERIGPTAIACAIGVASAACLMWVGRVAPRFSWGEVPSPHLAFDYLLLLGALLAAADLAYIEYSFTPLGANWPWHLLVVAGAFAALAVRYDSRVVLSLALSTFAAWRGVAVSVIEKGFWAEPGGSSQRLNALGCGALFIVVGLVLVRVNRKAHFEPVVAHAGWILILGALAFGMFDLSYDEKSGAAHELAYAVVLLAVGGALAAHAFRRRRFGLFAGGVLGVFFSLQRFAAELGRAERALIRFGLAIALIAFLIWAYRKMREPA